jgi:hypothetical protein
VHGLRLCNSSMRSTSETGLWCHAPLGGISGLKTIMIYHLLLSFKSCS